MLSSSCIILRISLLVYALSGSMRKSFGRPLWIIQSLRMDILASSVVLFLVLRSAVSSNTVTIGALDATSTMN